MINVLNAAEMRNVENYTMNNLGISSPVLMERAALASFNHICNRKPSNVLVFAGNGNNGGDGIAIARMMLLANINVTLCLVGNREKATKENINQLHTYLSLDGKLIELSDLTNLDSINLNTQATNNEKINSSFDVIIDALLGIGISRNLEGDYLNAVNLINKLNSYVYSLDIPTGINTDTGAIMGQAIKANETLCFSEYKLGLLLGKAPEYTGELNLFDVGIVPSTKITSGNFVHSLTNDDISFLLPKRPVTGHKGTFGKILIVGGSSKMAGAALLSSKSSFASGAGMVKLISPDINREAILSCIPELMYESSDNITDEDLDKNIEWADIIVIGPGLSTDENAIRLVKYVMANANIPVIVDADGLNILAENLELFNYRKDKNLITIITPHPGEFTRLFGNISSIENELGTSHVPYCGNPYDVKTLANMYGIIIVAKNARTIISDGHTMYINMSGTNGMGVAGSGDVLTGIIASILHSFIRSSKADSASESSTNNNKLNVISAVALAVYVHGLAGEKAAFKKSDYSMTALDIIENVNHLF